MKSEVKILRLGKNLAFDGSTTPACPDMKEDEYDNEPECKPQPRNRVDENKLPTQNFELEVDLEKGKEREKIKPLASSVLPTKQKRTRVLGRGILPFQLYEQEKQVWLACLLSILQPSSSFLLCSSTVQLVLNYLVV